VTTAGLMANIGNPYMDRDGRMVIYSLSKEVVDKWSIVVEPNYVVYVPERHRGRRKLRILP